MKQDGQMSLWDRIGPPTPWEAGKTADSIAFVLAGEDLLQGRKLSGERRRTLIGIVTRVKQGRWSLTQPVDPEDAIEKSGKLIAEGIIVVRDT